MELVIAISCLIGGVFALMAIAFLCAVTADAWLEIRPSYNERMARRYDRAAFKAYKEEQAALKEGLSSRARMSREAGVEAERRAAEWRNRESC